MRSNQTIKFFASFIKNTSDLSGKEKEILAKRLRKKPLEKIGKVYGVTEARIRQIEKEGLKKLRSKARQLALFQKIGRKLKKS